MMESIFSLQEAPQSLCLHPLSGIFHFLPCMLRAVCVLVPSTGVFAITIMNPRCQQGSLSFGSQVELVPTCWHHWWEPAPHRPGWNMDTFACCPLAEKSCTDTILGREQRFLTNACDVPELEHDPFP